MEYAILGIPENASLKDARSKLKEIRIKNHPDKAIDKEDMERRTKITLLAQQAYDTLKKKRDKRKLHKDDPFGASFFRTSAVTKFFDESFDNNFQHTQSMSYEYKNINGQETRRGTINGRRMTNAELENMSTRNRYPFFHLQLS